LRILRDEQRCYKCIKDIGVYSRNRVVDFWFGPLREGRGFFC
jgi:hypothetical protein